MPGGSIVYACGAVVVALVVVLLLLRYLARGSARRTIKSVERALQIFLAGVNRSDDELARGQMVPEQREALSPGRPASDFPEYIAHCEIVRGQFTRARSSDGRWSSLAKLLVRLDYQSGTSVEFLFLMLKRADAWQVDAWQEGGSYDLVDYTVE
ncbi:hypothetical protein [Phytohabitans rumicis]|uniref:DUF4878 domain-containing protein n=1 Tax=Phytohabitans rumicis TaxID=1076125 RepID=A0A6V8LG66_9ACTN|nr:hypothetical protein [Phytohabitans rumicis]GFJ93821.1 hypothetical protein Prum_074630 [Phytohabitans rumicis]